MTNIVSVPAGSFTPGATAALNFSAAVINAAWDQANVKATAFGSAVDSALSEISGAIPDITATLANPPDVVEPPISIGGVGEGPRNAVDMTELLAQYETQYLALVALLSDKFVAFRTAYFPTESAVYAQAESWISAAMSNPNQAIPVAVANQILSDDRNRAYAEANVLSEAVLAKFAANRFPLPPGAAASAVLQINQKAQDVIADSSRKLMMASVEQMKWAVEKALNTRQMAMQAAIEYIKALASGPAMANQIVGTGYDAQSKLISASTQFYSARVEADKVFRQVEQFNITQKLQADRYNQETELHRVEERVKSLMSEAQTLGQMAAAMFNNLHASSGTSYSVSGT